jgi:hypothetical protein
MKNRLNLSATLFLLAFFGSISGFSQEDRLQDLDSGGRDMRQESTSDYLMEGESKPLRPVTIPRDSVTVKPVAKKAEKGKDENSSVLSFNFLYYLIERYKLSDIVD